jgi:hypothetical protein
MSPESLGVKLAREVGAEMVEAGNSNVGKIAARHASEMNWGWFAVRAIYRQRSFQK